MLYKTLKTALFFTQFGFLFSGSLALLKIQKFPWPKSYLKTAHLFKVHDWKNERKKESHKQKGGTR